VSRDPYDNGFRYGTRGHDPADPNLTNAYHEIFAMIGPLKRAWEYFGVLTQFVDGVDNLRLGGYLRAVSPEPTRLSDARIEELAGNPITASMNIADLAAVLGLPADEPQCIVLELLRRVHDNGGLQNANHCK